MACSRGSHNHKRLLQHQRWSDRIHHNLQRLHHAVRRHQRLHCGLLLRGRLQRNRRWRPVLLPHHLHSLPSAQRGEHEHILRPAADQRLLHKFWLRWQWNLRLLGCMPLLHALHLACGRWRWGRWCRREHWSRWPLWRWRRWRWHPCRHFQAWQRVIYGEHWRSRCWQVAWLDWWERWVHNFHQHRGVSHGARRRRRRYGLGPACRRRLRRRERPPVTLPKLVRRLHYFHCRLLLGPAVQRGADNSRRLYLFCQPGLRRWERRLRWGRRRALDWGWRRWRHRSWRCSFWLLHGWSWWIRVLVD